MSAEHVESAPSKRRRRWLGRLGGLGLGAMTGKILLLLILTVILGVALDLVEELVDEREGRYRSVSREVGALWGMPQTISGPVLAVPYGVPGDRPGIAYALEKGVIYILPESLAIQARIVPEVRHRGIFETVVYRVEAVLAGDFSRPDASALQERLAGAGGQAGAGDDIRPEDAIWLWEKAYVAVGIPDMRSVGEVVELELDDATLPFRPGTGMGKLLPSGMSVDLPDVETRLGEAGMPFRLSLALNGSGSLSFLPLGRETRANVSSTWPSPSFSGAFLPISHEIDEGGFSADWKLSYFGRSYPQLIDGDALGEALSRQLQSSAFGVRLHQPVTPYRKVQRAIKYGMLFLVFTFGFYFIVEAVSRRRIHPVQYATVGVPLCLFYLLLVAFAEHIGFVTAYVLGAGAVVSLVALYSLKVLASRSRALWITVLLAGLYAYLYTLLEQESYSLLWGSCGLMLLTAVFMYVTRDVDWYGERRLVPGGNAPEPAAA